jgi:hypothetical protein
MLATLGREGDLMPFDDDVTLGELNRRMNRFEDNIRDKLNTISGQISSLQFVSKDAFDAVEARIKVIEERDLWRTRILVTALIMPFILAAIIAAVITRG